jgi:hypothetical protein
MVILVSEDSNRYAHLFLIEREYFGFNTLESVSKNECVKTFLDNFILFWVPSMKNINLNI